ncbi:MAG: hypothetical protein K1X89_20915 [Myxococcaceae bacterium]|nr:hypothetical protein [Myxococcaceae bacterium]
MSRGAGLASLLFPALALAWPADLQQDVAPGREAFARVASVDWSLSDAPAVATAEWLAASGELLVEGKQPGRAHLLLYAEGKLAVWTVRVGQSRRAFALPPSCPKLVAREGALEGTVDSVACLDALRTALESDGYLARELELTFSGEVLQVQLRRLTAALPKGLTARYVGAGVVLEGAASFADYQRALWVLFRESVGRVALEDRVEVSGRPDAGPPPELQEVAAEPVVLPAADAGRKAGGDAGALDAGSRRKTAPRSGADTRGP